MRRFFLPPDLLQREDVCLPADLLQHLKVLRISVGERIELFDGRGQRVQALITELHKSSGQARVEQRRQEPRPPLALRLIQGIPKGSKIDLVLQKGTELGISRFSPVYCQHGDVTLAAERLAGRNERWQKIIQEAARQSGRCHLPQLDEPVALDTLLPRVEDDMLLVAWEQAAEPLYDKLRNKRPQGITFLIGPEGGLAGEEVAMARDVGFQTVSLGPRILRSETAGIAVASILQYLFGDLGSAGAGRLAPAGTNCRSSHPAFEAE